MPVPPISAPFDPINKQGWGPREARPLLQRRPPADGPGWEAIGTDSQRAMGQMLSCTPRGQLEAGGGRGGGTGSGVGKGGSFEGALMPPALTPRAPWLHEETQRQLPGC